MTIPVRRRERRQGMIPVRVALAAALLLAGGCFRDHPGDAGALTAAERAAFVVPADSSLTSAQVDAYLETVIAQLALIQEEGAEVRSGQIRPETTTGSALSGDGGRGRVTEQARWSDFVDATFVRAARRAEHRPAEQLYVRDRISATGSYIRAAKAHAGAGESAALFRQQAESMRGTPGVTEEQIAAMLRAAQRAEQPQERPVRPRLEQNLAVLRRSRPALSEDAWVRIAGVAGGGEISELGSLPDSVARNRLQELLRLHRAALESQNPQSDP